MFGSCLSIIPPAVNPVIIGLKFTQGKGTRMIDADNNTYRAGGGLLFKDTYPRVEYNSFIENGFYENEDGQINTVGEGGAITGTDDGIDEVIIAQQRETREDTLIFRHNIYLSYIVLVNRLVKR